MANFHAGQDNRRSLTITESAGGAGRDSFTFQRKRVAFGGGSAELFGHFLDLLVARLLGQLFTGRQRVVGDSGAGAGDRLVDWLFVRSRADLFSVLGHARLLEPAVTATAFCECSSLCCAAREG